jgi:hypothetical protein
MQCCFEHAGSEFRFSSTDAAGSPSVGCGIVWRTRDVKMRREEITDDDHELVIERMCAIDVGQGVGKGVRPLAAPEPGRAASPAGRCISRRSLGSRESGREAPGTTGVERQIVCGARKYGPRRWNDPAGLSALAGHRGSCRDCHVSWLRRRQTLHRPVRRRVC